MGFLVNAFFVRQPVAEPSGADAYLIETGDNLLLETGDNYLLE